MQSFFLFVYVKVQAAADAVRPKQNPLVQNLPYSHNARLSADKNIEVAAVGIFKRRKLEKARHQLFRICSALKLQRDFQSRFIGFVTHIVNIAQLSALNQLGKLVNNRFNRCAVGNFGDFNYILFFHIAVL